MKIRVFLQRILSVKTRQVRKLLKMRLFTCNNNSLHMSIRNSIQYVGFFLLIHCMGFCLYFCVYLSDTVSYSKQCSAVWKWGRQGDVRLEFKTKYWCIIGLWDVAKVLKLPRTWSSHYTYSTYLLPKIICYIFVIKSLL